MSRFVHKYRVTIAFLVLFVCTLLGMYAVQREVDANQQHNIEAVEQAQIASCERANQARVQRAEIVEALRDIGFIVKATSGNAELSDRILQRVARLDVPSQLDCDTIIEE